ncbi:MAG TPA: L,D-transpeptidase family protein [Jatrophihabitans sp.]|jgi:L,D-peptidoglycan transpeptidase YkuD (ErfK/YbiS/YcfS/YnhG family)
MTIRRVLSAAALLIVVAVSAAVALTVGRTNRPDDRASVPPPVAASTSVYQPSVPATTTAQPPSSARPSTPAPKHTTATPPPVTHSSVKPPPARPIASTGLPVSGSTIGAGQIITVDAPAWGATRANLQTWQRQGNGWSKVGPAVSAWLGSAGMSTNAREGFNGTPVGSFGLTQAFGNNADPGSPMPYFQATADDWWSGDSASPTYNSHQHCAASTCPFRTSESENLHDAGWVYGYALVINYNMFPARPGKGSAFFLHVTENQPTAGCVSIPADQMVRILHWLNPAAHPRIIMGVS